MTGDTTGVRPVRDRFGATWAFGIAALSIALLAGLFALQRFVDFDVLWHVRTGEWILRIGQIPRTDPFGGRTTGMPWLDVAWGFQVIAAAVVGRVGLTGLQLAVVTVVMGTLLLYFRAAPRTPLVLAGALLFVLATGFRFLVRPDILTFPLVLAAMGLVDRLGRAPRSSVVLIGLLTAAWANLHGSFVIVPLLVLAGGAGAWIDAPTPRSWKEHASALAIATLAPLANPCSFRIYGVLSPYLRSMLAAFGVRPPAEGLPVLEWAPTWRAMAQDAIFPTVAFALLVLLLVLSFLLRGWGGGASRLLCGALMLALALTAVRNLLPFGAAALWILSANERDRLADASRAAPMGMPAAMVDAGWARVTAALAVAAVTWSYLVAVVSDRYYVDREVPVVTGVGINLDLVPEGAVAWLATHQAPGVLFNNYDSGAYLLYRLAPNVRTYIDPRFDVTPVNREIRQALSDPAVFASLADREGIGTIVLQHPSPESLTLLPRLARDPGWTLAFRDANSTIHVRAGSPPAPRPQPIALDPPLEPAATRINTWLARFKSACLPAAELTDAFVSAVLGDHEREGEAYRRALDRCPDNPRALAFLASEPAASGR